MKPRSSSSHLATKTVHRLLSGWEPWLSRKEVSRGQPSSRQGHLQDRTSWHSSTREHTQTQIRTHKQMAKRSPKGSVDPSVDYSYHFQKGDDIDFLGFGWRVFVCLTDAYLSMQRITCLSVSGCRTSQLSSKIQHQLINKRFHIYYLTCCTFIKWFKLCCGIQTTDKIPRS